ncbi:MAG: aminotransferase, partial [Acutalibacteraceae bacterium]
MKQIFKSEKMDNVKYEIRGPVLEEAMLLERSGVEIIKLNIGNPAPYGFNTPQNVLDTMHEHIRDAQGYSESKGLRSSREAIKKYCD